ncbi:hypothetical protein N1851_022497 [Merluccius polli]|uniref:Uncharacterized protein n=1 Tax=Merluccius polli TaxID=89951 RepID=A0AA47MHQ6_MERPO|nr:hypothetical protein N1851_022497 [Merluccius polli]
MVGDFNIFTSMPFFAALLLISLISLSFNFIQHGPTQIRDHTMDLVFTLGLNMDSICSEELLVTDHECVLFNLSFILDSLPSKCVNCSRIKLPLSRERSVDFHTDVASLVHSFNTHYSAVLDKVAPIKMRLVPFVDSSPWLNYTIRCFRRKCRRVERLEIHQAQCSPSITNTL